MVNFTKNFSWLIVKNKKVVLMITEAYWTEHIKSLQRNLLFAEMIFKSNICPILNGYKVLGYQIFEMCKGTPVPLPLEITENALNITLMIPHDTLAIDSKSAQYNQTNQTKYRRTIQCNCFRKVLKLFESKQFTFFCLLIISVMYVSIAYIT